ncbi:hypothetical protein EB796_005351 [Bugula neritina]|uniref:Uncharacterized protein n=1 Tax=Bugula neritina TaxID=10212 RepID=A0A7J7KDJ2_BUGNE|nr:hypothetical protein EB796_005351 [Bugula neritina]
MKRKMAESVTNNIKIISKASAKSSAAQRSPAVVSRPSVISKTQLPVQTSAGRGVSRLPLSTPVVSSLVRGGATRSEVKLRPSSHPLLTSAVTGAAAATSRTSREFIDIGELSKENSKKEKSNVEKETTGRGGESCSKPSADTSAASAVLSNSDLSTQSELIPKSAVDSRADSLIPKNDAPELALQPADSCDDSDDLVGVTPRRSTRISADQASSAANDESKKKSMSDAAKHPTFDELASTPGPSGLTKRGLKLLLKRQSEEATNTQKKNGAADEEAAVTNNGANTDINKPSDDELAPTPDRAVSEPGRLEDELSGSADVIRGNSETVSNGETFTQSVESDRETSEDNSHVPMECMDSADVSTALNDSSSAVDCFKKTGSAEKKSAQKQRHTRKTSSRHNEVLDKTPKTAEFVETSSEEETTEAVVTADPSRISGADSTDEKSPGKEKNRSKRRQKKVSPTSASKTAPKSAATVESSEDETEVTSRLSFDDSVTENLPQTSSVEEICDESLNEIEKTVTSKPSRSKSPDGVISDNEDLDIPDKATEIKQKSTGGKVVEAMMLMMNCYSTLMSHIIKMQSQQHQKKERKPNKDTKTKADGNENDSVQEVADSGDAAGSDVENEMAMNNLKNALMSSDSDSDHVLPPRRVLRRQAKLSPSKRVKSKENKTERKLTQQEKQLRQLNPAQQRYIRRRTAGLLVSLREQKETVLQKLVKEIEEKSVAEMDSLNKLQMRPEVKVERIDAENEEAVKRLVDLHMQSAKNTMSVSELIAKNKTAADQRRQDAGESEGDSDVEKEIKRLSKLNILLNRNKSAIQRSKPKKKEVKTRRKIRKIVHDSLSEASSEHNSEAEENSSSEMEDNSADIILIPDKEQLDNEEAMKNLLQTLTDSDSDAKASASSGSSLIPTARL